AWSWQASLVLAAGLTLTSLIVIYLLLSLKRTLHLEFLTRSLRAATKELRRESEKVTELAHKDSMTGLANRAAFAGHLEQAFTSARRDGGRFAVMCLDLDHFKDV